MKLRKSMLAVSLAAANLALGHASAATSTPQFTIPQSFIKASPQENAALTAALVARHGNEGLDGDHGYLLTKEHPGPAGSRISRFSHTYKGLRVLGSDSVVVSDGRGSILSTSESDRRFGLGQGAANTLNGANLFDVAPSVQSRAAIDQIVRDAAPNGQHRYAPSAELVIQPIVKRVRVPGAEFKPEAKLNALDLEDKVTGYQLVWLVKVRMADNGKPVFRDAIVSAEDGRILTQWDALQTGIVGVGHSQFSGDVPIQTTLSGGVYRMLDPARGTGGQFGGMAVSDAAHGPVPGTLYTNATNVWGDGLPYNGGSTSGPNGQTAAVDALWAQMNNYDMLKNTLGWLSLDGNNTASYIAVHVGTNMDNAYYDSSCNCMSIGDGTGSKGLASLDIIGHELGHGITGATSALNYSGESGGLNESSSDINGEMVEAYARNGGTGNVIPSTGNDWMLGREISPNGTPMRWMWKPSKDGASKDAWTSTLGSLNPHYSSGPNNRMFYFLSQGSNATPGDEKYSAYLTQNPHNMTGIGSDKAYRIWFRANTTKFTSSTNYADARAKMIQSANELYGVGSKESIAVTRAYAAINVGQDIPEGAQLDLIKNGSFESGATNWNGSVNVIGSWPNQAAYDGSKYALFGGKGVTNNAALTQAITIPATATAANLSFALHIDSAETTASTAYDKLVVTVKNTAGAVLGTLATYSNLNKALGYSVKNFSLLPYKGQAVVLSFSASEDSSLQTSFVVDKVSLIQ
ncbi:M4 family metallopeptidase [Pseudoduganella violaceinigra]|uniref:M4 family metallopeptidase n=1 Tax=Pseudoduganella violaceinigra TaxID=246602 RepID=UPI00048A2353|nr:M4 family metallopeptidase [Pseudoduganella violaceinigra]